MSKTNKYTDHHFKLGSSTGKWTLTACIMASSMAFIDTSALNVVLPSLQEDLDATGTDLFWVLNSYLVMLSALIIVGGSLGDKLGRVKTFGWGILVFTIASILCGLSASIEQLIWFRILQGIGGAFMIPGSLSIIAAIFSSNEKGKAIGTWSATTVLVTMGGPILGGALADIGLWRYIFYLNVPLGILSIFILFFKVPESKAKETAHSIDWVGAILLAVSLASFTFGFLNIPEIGLYKPSSYLSLIVGGVTFVGFIFHENRVQGPMVPLGIFRNRTFSGVNLLTFSLYAGLNAIMLFLSLNMIQIQGYSQMEAGMTFLPFTILMALIARKVGSLTDKWGARPFLIAGPLITAAGFLLLGFIGQTKGPGDFWTHFFPGIVVFGIGMSITVVPLTTTVMSAIDQELSGIASGVNNSITRISGTFINAVVGAAAVFFFTMLVSDAINSKDIPKEVQADVIKASIDLGKSEVPESVKESRRTEVQNIYDAKFITIYQWVCYVSAAMALLSALFGALMIKPLKYLKGNQSPESS